MLVTFEMMTMGKQKQWQGQSQGNGNDNLYSFVVLAMLKALAMAKNVVSLVVYTMAKTLINNACIHVQIVSEQLLAAEDKLKHKAAVAYVLQQHVASPMVTKAMAKAKAKAMTMTSLFPLGVGQGNGISNGKGCGLTSSMHSGKDSREQKTQQLHSNGSSNIQHKVMATAFSSR